jgi:hypothetical protein
MKQLLYVRVTTTECFDCQAANQECIWPCSLHLSGRMRRQKLCNHAKTPSIPYRPRFYYKKGRHAANLK